MSPPRSPWRTVSMAGNVPNRLKIPTTGGVSLQRLPGRFSGPAGRAWTLGQFRRGSGSLAPAVFQISRRRLTLRNSRLAPGGPPTVPLPNAYVRTDYERGNRPDDHSGHRQGADDDPVGPPGEVRHPAGGRGRVDRNRRGNSAPEGVEHHRTGNVRDRRPRPGDARRGRRSLQSGPPGEPGDRVGDRVDGRVHRRRRGVFRTSSTHSRRRRTTCSPRRRPET